MSTYRSPSLPNLTPPEQAALTGGILLFRGNPLPPLSVLGIVPSSRAALRRRYHVRRDIPSASQGRSASLLPSREALAFLALPVCFADRAACFLIHRGQCQPRGAHRRLYFSICLAVACTSESGSGWWKSWLAASKAGSTSRCSLASRPVHLMPASNRSKLRPTPVWRTVGGFLPEGDDARQLVERVRVSSSPCRSIGRAVYRRGVMGEHACIARIGTYSLRVVVGDAGKVT